MNVFDLNTLLWKLFVRFIGGGGRLLAVFRRAFSHHQRWGLGLAQYAFTR